MSKTSSMTKRIQPYLEIGLYRRFKRYCEANNQTESSVVEAALSEYLDDSNDMELTLRELGRIRRALSRMDRDVTTFAEFMGVFVQVWLAHTPKLPPAQKEAAERLAYERFEQLIDYANKSLGKGRGFLKDMYQEEIVSRADIQDAITQAEKEGSHEQE